jgi:hypothetical protein
LIDINRNVDLQHNNYLRIFRVIYVDNNYLSLTQVPVLSIFARITSFHMEEVILEVPLTYRGLCQQELDWVNIDRVFARPNFSHLKRILIIVHNRYMHNTQMYVMSWLEKRLPACHARGIIDVEFRSD